MRILLADDHDMFREGLKSLLHREQDLSVVGEARDGRGVVQLTQELMPDVVIMDVRMPDLNGIDATRQCLQVSAGTKILALSAQSDDQTTTEMLRAGARGYVVKHSAFEELVSAIRVVAAGKVYLSPSVAQSVVRNYVDRVSDHSSIYQTLTAREREVLQLTAEGSAAKVIARQLHLSVKTIETHRRNIMAKLNVDSIAGLTRYAIREGICSL